MVDSINQVLEETLTNLNLTQKIKEKKVLNIWSQVIGERIRKHTQASYINQGTLFVKVSNSTWAQQLLFLKEKFITQLNDRLEEKIVDDIRFKLGSINKKEVDDNNTPKTKESLAKIELTNQELNEIKNTLTAVNDTELTDKLESILIKQRKLNKWKENNGWVQCDYCSTYHPKEADCCLVCQIKSQESCNRLENILVETPWLSYDKISTTLPHISITNYQQAKEELLTKFWQQIEVNIPRVLDGSDQNLVRQVKVLIHNYVMLKTDTHPSQLSNSLIKKSIGDNYFQVYNQL
ncbi:MAG: DUF721 domain-containing protein [Bacillota bacterium]